MRTAGRIVALATALVASRAAIANLILNPGNELPLVGGNIPHWTEVTGTQWTQRFENPTAFEGEAYFFAGPVSFGELMQDVPVVDLVSLGKPFQFVGYVHSWPQTPADTSRIVVEYRGGDSVLGTFDSGPYSNPDAWVRITDTRLAPAGTDTIRIRLQSTRRAGNNNDGYFDALSLEVLTSCPLDLVPDGIIDGDDYHVIDSAYLRSLADCANGDFDGNGVINGDDYYLLDQAFLAPWPGAAGATAVPDPALLAPMLAILACVRRSRKAPTCNPGRS